MQTPWAGAAASLAYNLDSVLRLLTFDRDIVEVAVGALTVVKEELARRNLHSVITPVANRTALLQNLATNESLKPQYDAMFNQCVVLLVSYFGSGLHNLFRVSVVAALRSGIDLPVRNEALTVSWRGLEGAEGDREAIFADLLVAQKDISFQDMKSIGRAFGDLLGVAVTRGVHTDNIILGQAARHAMVHAGGHVDDRMVKQLVSVKARTLKTALARGELLRFSPSEVRELADSMRTYVQDLCESLDTRFGDTYSESA